jgi:putative hemolysin
MSATVVEILIIVALVVANGIFALSEAALISARKARLQQRANEGDIRAKLALDLIADPSVFLATVQIGITLIGILAGAFGGATLAEPLSQVIATVDFLEPQADALGFAIVVLFTVYLSLIVGELVPKHLALNNPERITLLVARPMHTLSRIASPVVRLLNASTDLVLRLLNVRPSNEPTVTEEEINVMIHEGTQTGQFAVAERDLVSRVFRLDDLHVEAILRPRTEVTWLDIEDSREDIERKIRESGRSRFPVAQGGLDNVLGIVQARDLLTRLLSHEPLDLNACLQPPLFVPGTITVLKLLSSFRESNTQLALVLDEYGGLQGMVTITDVIEEMVGGSLGEGETEPRAVRRDDGSWLLDGLMPIQEVKDTLSIRDALPGEDDGDYKTLGGFMMNQIGHIPISSDHIEALGWRFEVIDMDGHRVDKVLVAPQQTDPLPPQPPDPAG